MKNLFKILPLLLLVSSAWAGETSLKKLFSDGSIQEFAYPGAASYDFDKHQKNLFYVWASWCPYCKAATPKFVKQYDKIKNCSSVGVASINVDKDRDAAEKAIGDWNLSGLHMYRDEKDILKTQVKSGIPKLIVTDNDGNILRTYVGAQDIHRAVAEVKSRASKNKDCKN